MIAMEGDGMQGFALIHSAIAPLMVAPTQRCELADEALHGMKVTLLQETPDGWFRMRTHYAYEGFVHSAHLTTDSALLSRWEGLPKLVVTKAQADILWEPKVQGWQVASLTRGALVAPLATADENGWQPVALCDGREGYTKAGYLGEHITSWRVEEETALRGKLVDTALCYLGVQYRWGGKTPQGIDCSGLTSMAYLLNGILIYRDADICDGFPMRKIAVEEAREGDLIFFKGHVAMHLGDGRIVHATARNGSDGVVLDSLNPQHSDYRPDLVPIIKFAGTIF